MSWPATGHVCAHSKGHDWGERSWPVGRGGVAVARSSLPCSIALSGQALGLRPAEAGEFSRRAFDAGKLDLTQASWGDASRARHLGHPCLKLLRWWCVGTCTQRWLAPLRLPMLTTGGGLGGPAGGGDREPATAGPAAHHRCGRRWQCHQWVARWQLTRWSTRAGHAPTA